MKQTNKLAVSWHVGICPLGPGFCARRWLERGRRQAARPGTTGLASSAPHVKHKKGSGGTTLHQEDKASHLKGASAAKAASALGTNDKGAPQ